MMRLRPLIPLLAVLLAAGVTARPAAAQPSPLQVEADQIVYDEADGRVHATGHVRLRYRGIRLAAETATFDLRRELLEASGQVVLIDPNGRELRGDTLTYDVRLELAELRSAETVIDRVYVRGERVRAQPRLIELSDASLTTCDPARPGYRVTARQIEITPGERLVARQATLWLGRYRVLTVPVLVISLRSTQETARSFPRVGYNHVDGFWAEYVQGYDLGTIPGTLALKYGTRSGFGARNTLRFQHPPYQAALVVGRNQNADLVIFDQAELIVSRAAQRLGTTPLFLWGSVQAGEFRESDRGVQTSRLMYTLGLRTATLQLGPATTWDTEAAWEDAFYGIGARQSLLQVTSQVAHTIDAQNTLRLTYRLVEVKGGTPFAFDAISSRPHDISLQFVHSDARGPVARSFNAGTTYDFRTSTVAVNAGVGRRVPGRYHWSLGASYNLDTRETTLSTASGLSIGYGTYFTVEAEYNTTQRLFKEAEAVLTSRLCDCFDLSLRYRWAHESRSVQEVWLEIAVSGFPESRLQFQFSRP